MDTLLAKQDQELKKMHFALAKRTVLLKQNAIFSTPAPQSSSLNALAFLCRQQQDPKL